MDAIDFLLRDHRRHEELLDKTQGDPLHYGALKKEIVHHVRIEESEVFPALLKVPAVEATVRAAWEEHNLVMQLLQELDAEQSGSKTWRAKLEVLRKLHLEHLRGEEDELFPFLRQHVAQSVLQALGDHISMIKFEEPTNEILYPEIPGSHTRPGA